MDRSEIDASGPASFLPDAVRGAALDRAVRRRLAASLAHIAARAGAVLGESAGALAEIRAFAESRPLAPGVFARYYDLVPALVRGEIDPAQQLLAEMAAIAADAPSLRVRPFAAAALGDDLSRYRRLFDLDPQRPIAPAEPDAAVCAAFAERLELALRMLADAAPDLEGEIRALVREVVIAVPARGTAGAPFNGAASFLLWGAVLLNPRQVRTAVEVAEGLVHEAAHLLLFGHELDGALVENDPADRHPSPLRSDPRPMMGIYHATCVTARMHHAVARLLASGRLDAGETAAAAARLRQHAEAFRVGLATIERSGRLSARGAALLERARACMRTAA